MKYKTKNLLIASDYYDSLFYIASNLTHYRKDLKKFIIMKGY